MRTGRRVFISGIFVILMSLAGCVSLPESFRLPEGRIGPPVLTMGDYWIYREVKEEMGEESTYKVRVIKQDFFRGALAYYLEYGENTQVWTPTLNVIATQEGKKVLEENVPDSGTFQWPLFVGKQWTSLRSIYNRVNGHSLSPVETLWSVEGKETVQTPAGRFEALRLVSSPSRNDAAQETLWYVPQVKNIVKRRIDRTPAHHLGAGVVTVELLEYSLR